MEFQGAELTQQQKSLEEKTVNTTPVIQEPKTEGIQVQGYPELQSETLSHGWGEESLLIVHSQLFPLKGGLAPLCLWKRNKSEEYPGLNSHPSPPLLSPPLPSSALPSHPLFSSPLPSIPKLGVIWRPWEEGGRVWAASQGPCEGVIGIRVTVEIQC